MRFTKSGLIDALLIVAICSAVSALACQCHERQTIRIEFEGERVF